MKVVMFIFEMERVILRSIMIVVTWLWVMMRLMRLIRRLDLITWLWVHVIVILVSVVLWLVMIMRLVGFMFW